MLRLLTAILLLLPVLGATRASALESNRFTSPRDTASLVSEVDTVVPHGATATPIDWPTPRRIAEGPLMTYAYSGDLLLPVTITPTGGDTAVRAHAEWLVCREICVPEEADFQLDLLAGAGQPSAQAPLFAALARQLPRPSPWHAVIGNDGTLLLQGPELTPATVVDAWFIPNASGVILDSAAQPLTVWHGGFTLGLRPAKGFQASAPLTGVLSVRDRSGLETDVNLNAQPGAVPAPPPAISLNRALLLAFIGGLILNLMPCVFPVLALKVIALAGAPRGKARWQAVAYTAGVLVAFACLGATLLAARAAGSAAGWGFQFQSPVFVAAMAWLLFAIGLNLSGVFAVGSGLVRTGHGLATRPGQLGSFFTGLLAVVVATPCTAPFMGVAIAAGLAAPPGVTMLVFVVMGLGLAAPYALLASAPALGRLAPRPGRWMELLRQILAFPMYGASAWLVWVISQEAGPTGVLATSAGLVLLGFAGWMLGITQNATDKGRRIGQSAAAAAALAALAVLSGIATVPPAPADAAAASGAEPFSASRLATLRAEGRPVFVDMTAAWCVTCLVNERVAIDTTAVRQAFAEHHVAYMRGDWTRQDPHITDYLRENGRDGVPLYVYYPPSGQPQILPQILTENTVLSELNRG
jgi:thiol:disulfide interchange protein DsbD